MRKHRIKYAPPWCWPLIEMLNPAVRWGKVMFAFGDTIYSPRKVRKEELVHERVHLRQQKYSKFYGLFVYLRYNISPKFRLQCELEAYRAELRYVRESADFTAGQYDLLSKAHARSLSSAVYGKIISYKEAYLELMK